MVAAAAVSSRQQPSAAVSRHAQLTRRCIVTLHPHLHTPKISEASLLPLLLHATAAQPPWCVKEWTYV